MTALVSGYPKRGYTLLCGTLGVICTVRVIAGFARGMLLRQRQMQAMKSSAQAVQEKFEQAQATLRQTAAFRHDLKIMWRPWSFWPGSRTRRKSRII